MTIFLKFSSEAEARTTLADFYDEEFGWKTASHTHAIDPVGLIHKPTGNMIQSDEGEHTEMATISGWHINFIGTLPDAALPYVVQVSTPSRKFA